MDCRRFGRLLSLALSLAIVLLVTSCDRKDSETVRVGAILPMTGSGANFGELMSRGITLALEESSNQVSPGISRLDVIIEDSKSTPRDGVSAMQKLLEFDRVAAVMPALSGVVLAVAPIAERNQVVLLNCPANSPMLREAGDFVFNITILSDQESHFLADYAYNTLHARSAAVAFVNNEYGRGYGDSFSNAFTAAGGTVKLSEAHEQGATEFRTAIEKFRAAEVDLVFLATYYSEGALILKQSGEARFQSTWLSNSSMETPDFLRLAGDAAEGIIFSQPGFDAESTDEITKNFVERYKARYGIDPDFWTAQYYDGTRLLIAAVAAGARTGPEIKSYLERLENFPGMTGPIQFDSTHGVTRSVRFKTVKDGTFQYVQGDNR